MFRWTEDRLQLLSKALEQFRSEGQDRPAFGAVARYLTKSLGRSVSANDTRHGIDALRRRDVEPTTGITSLASKIDALSQALERERDRTAALIGVYRELLPPLAQLAPYPAPSSGKGKDEESHVAMLDLSDAHIGEKVDVEVTGGLGEYNFEIFLARLEILRRGVHRLTDLARKQYPVDTLYLNLLGDLLTGERVFRNQGFSLDLSLQQQLMEGTVRLSLLIEDFARLYRNVYVRAVPGNHGNERDGSPRTNWDSTLYGFLKDRLRNYSNVIVEDTETSYLLYELPAHERGKHLLIHGEQARSWMGIPFYGLIRAGGLLTSLLGQTFDYVHAGHHHTPGRVPWNQTEIVLNGSWVGGDDLSVRKLLRAVPPSQNFFFLHPRRGVVDHHLIQLDAPTKFIPGEDGIYRPSVARGVV